MSSESSQMSGCERSISAPVFAMLAVMCVNEEPVARTLLCRYRSKVLFF